MARYMMRAGKSCCTTCRPSVCDPCGGDCCLYPWPDPDGVSGGPFYRPEDLPDEVVVHSGSDLFVTETLSRQAGTYTYTSDLYRLAPTRPVGAEEPSDWLVALKRDYRGYAEGYPIVSGSCLILDQAHSANPDAWITDQFEDAYTVTGGLSGAVTVTRGDLCAWSGGGVVLSYLGGSSCKWQVNGHSKSGRQNDPKGSYAGGYTVS